MNEDQMGVFLNQLCKFHFPYVQPQGSVRCILNTVNEILSVKLCLKGRQDNYRMLASRRRIKSIDVRMCRLNFWQSSPIELRPWLHQQL